MDIVVVIIAVGSIVINVGLVALCFKLYTEYYKDKSQSSRKV